MNDTLSLIADILTILGTLLTTTLELHRARQREAGQDTHQAQQDDEPPQK
ncbi:hypothetical protein ACFVQ4_34300 [Streptomyces laurentii]